MHSLFQWFINGLEGIMQLLLPSEFHISAKNFISRVSETTSKQPLDFQTMIWEKN